MKDPSYKNQQIHLPLTLWRVLMMLKAEGKIDNLKDACLEAVRVWVEERRWER